MKPPISIGVLHPTFESWGGAEWFIHGLLTTWAARGEIKAVLYTYRWSDPPGDRARYPVVTHGLGGIVSGPWDWRAVGKHLSSRWNDHDVLFVHNYPAGEWARGSNSAPPFVWYCQEPPRSLWEARDDARREGSWRPQNPRQVSHSIRRLGPGRAFWRFSSRLRLSLAQHLIRRKRWADRLRTWDLETVRLAASIIANSRFTAGRIASIYGRRATTAYPLLPHFEPRAPIPAVKKEPVVLWVGRLAREKRPEMLLRAWQRIVEHTNESNFRLVLIGDGPLATCVEEHVAPLATAGRAEWHRSIPRCELLELYPRALLTVYLGEDEPFGLVPLESMWEGTPVLAACEGGIKETVIPNETGYCLENPTVENLAGRLSRLLRQPDALQQLGRHAAVEVRRRFSFDKTLEIIEKELRNAVVSTNS